MKIGRYLAILGLLAISPYGGAAAHEFWIMPERFMVEPGSEITIDLREGEAFVGKPISYHSRRFHQFELLSPSGQTPVRGRPDAIPAASLALTEPGLNVLIYQSKLSLITYDDLAKFESFLASMQLDWGLAEHRARGLPEEGIREAYFRYAKALVQVGDGEAGADAKIGMPLELVALNNPYRKADELRVQLFYKEQAYADQPVFVFTQGADGVEKTWYRTDDKGIATIPLDRSAAFQINAVHLQPASERMTKLFGAVWQTLWASMTFETVR